MGRLIAPEHYCGAPSPRPSLGDQYGQAQPGENVQSSTDQQQQLHVYGYVAGQQGYPMPVQFKVNYQKKNIIIIYSA